MQDKAGRKINVGDLIVYGHALGRCAGLQYGKVIGFLNGKVKVISVNQDYGNGKGFLNPNPGYLQYGDRIVVIPASLCPWHIKELLKYQEVSEPQCTGTLVHSEFERCPKCDR